MRKTKSIIAMIIILAMVMTFIPFKVFATDTVSIQLNGALNVATINETTDNIVFDTENNYTVDITTNSTTKNITNGEGHMMLTVDVGSTVTFKFNTDSGSMVIDGTNTNLDANKSYTYTAVAKAGNAPTIMDFNFGNQQQPGPQLGFDGTVIQFDGATVSNDKITFDVEDVKVTATVTGTDGTYAFNGNKLEVDDGALDGIRIKLDNNFKSNEMSVYVIDGNTQKEIVVNGDNEITFNDANITDKNLHLGITTKQGGNNNQQGGTDDIEFDAKFTGTHMIVSINNVSVMDDADGNLKDTFVGKVEKAGTTDPTKTNELKLINVFGDRPVKEYVINDVTYKEGDEGVVVDKYGGFTITVPGAKKYTIRGTADKDAAVDRTIIWTNPNYVPKDKADAEWIEEFKLENGYGYVKAVYDENGKLVNVDEYKSENWAKEGVGSNGFGWIHIYPGYRVVFEFVPEYGYQLTDIRINGQKLGVSGLMNQFEFEMPDTNIHFDAEFTKTEDIVKANSTKIESGTVSLGNNTLSGGSAQLTVNDIELSSDKIKGFEDAAEGYTVSSYLDIDLYQVFYKGKNDANDVWSTKIDEFDNEVTITIKLQEGITADDIVIVHNIHDGEEYEIIKIESYDSATNTITFKTKSFSNYAIATKNEAKVDETTETTTDKNTTNPSTGDNVTVFIAIFAIAVLGIVVIAKVNKNNKKARKH